MPLLRSFLLLASLATLPAMADEQAFYHITAQQCSVIDSIPVFTEELRPTQSAGNYRIELLFPEYRELTSTERALIPALRSKLGTPTAPKNQANDTCGSRYACNLSVVHSVCIPKR